MNPKDQYELDYWKSTDRKMHIDKNKMYVDRWGVGDCSGLDVLEVGLGPFNGCLGLISAALKVGVDPLIQEYEKAGLLARLPDIEYNSCRFEDFVTARRFDVILTADTLDHGDLGFHVVPRLAEHLVLGGSLYIHVHLRPESYLNVAHDHQLTTAQLADALSRTKLIEERREILEHDIDGKFCPALMGVWRLCY